MANTQIVPPTTIGPGLQRAVISNTFPAGSLTLTVACPFLSPVSITPIIAGTANQSAFVNELVGAGGFTLNTPGSIRLQRNDSNGAQTVVTDITARG